MKRQKQGLQSSPFDSVIPDLRQSQSTATVEEPQRGEGGDRPQRTPKRSKSRKRFTAHVSEELIERAKNAVYWTPGLTMALLVERGLDVILSELEEKQGGAFPEREMENPGGRPIR